MNQSINIRKTLGISQKELADILNISCKHLSQYENETAIVPKEMYNELDLIYSYMKLAISYRVDLNTMYDYMAQRKAVEQQLQENKKQRDQISDHLTKVELKYNEVLAKKSMLWLFAKDKKDHLFSSYQRLEDYLKKPSDFPQTEVMIYKTKLNVLNFEKGKLEAQWRKLESEIEYLVNNPDVNAARELK
jgi:transcriptional regulator with XRE-family HTH domain